jgi:uncharacterized protein (DUF2147 family)
MHFSRDRASNARLWILGLSILAGYVATGCSGPESAQDTVTRQTSPMLGIWKLGNTESTVAIDHCEDEPEQLCGKLMSFPGDPNARDFLNAGFLDWGRRLCESTVIFGLSETEEPQVFSGRLYDPGEGQTYQLSLRLHSDNQAQARTYLGATVDGAIGLGVSAATGELTVLDTVSYAVRAFIGKKHLGETVIWSRLDKPTTHCNA